MARELKLTNERKNKQTNKYKKRNKEKQMMEESRKNNLENTHNFNAFSRILPSSFVNGTSDK